VGGGDMTKNNQDELARSYAMLSSFRKNIDQIYDVTTKYVNEYHNVLTKLEGMGINISEFRIPDSEVTKRVTGGSYITGEKWYSDEKYVDRAYFLIKLDAVLSYFEIITSEKPKRIGFRTSQE
jgi:hypothetical protein